MLTGKLKNAKRKITYYIQTNLQKTEKNKNKKPDKII
jgi:hypothetical protein